MTNKERFLKLVSKEKTSTLKKIKERIKNRAMLKESQKIALKVLLKLDEMNWSQKDLAKKMNVSPQQVNKIVRGKENLTLETQIKLQVLLDIPLLASYYEEQKSKEIIPTFKKVEGYAVAIQPKNNYISSKIIKMEFNKISDKYSYKEAV